MAYKMMCAARGFDLDWDFKRYCQAAHYHSDALKEQIYAKFPALYRQEPSWEILYAEKKANIMKLFREGAVQLMPGVKEFLKELNTLQIKHCVVTHSPEELVQIVRQQHAILETIPFWVTRKLYSNPKPDPECYLKAISQYATATDKVIGFEDTPRGLTALLGTRAKPVLICQTRYPEIPAFIEKGVIHLGSFEGIQDNPRFGS